MVSIVSGLVRLEFTAHEPKGPRRREHGTRSAKSKEYSIKLVSPQSASTASGVPSGSLTHLHSTPVLIGL